MSLVAASLRKKQATLTHPVFREEKSVSTLNQQRKDTRFSLTVARTIHNNAILTTALLCFVCFCKQTKIKDELWVTEEFKTDRMDQITETKLQKGHMNRRPNICAGLFKLYYHKLCVLFFNILVLSSLIHGETPTSNSDGTNEIPM